MITSASKYLAIAHGSLLFCNFLGGFPNGYLGLSSFGFAVLNAQWRGMFRPTSLVAQAPLAFPNSGCVLHDVDVEPARSN
jgi:hypothetical protein